MSGPTKEQIKSMADRAEARARGGTAKEFIHTAMSEGEIDVEIKKLAALPEGVYESSRKAALERLPEGWRGGVLDRLVKTERAKTTKEQNDFLPHWKVTPWLESVDGAALLTGLRKHFSRYVVLPSHADVVLALWTLHTWIFDCFDITPYLAITSPTRRCGKTLLMTMLYWLCCRAKKNDSMSKAAIYRSVDRDKPTLCLDEVAWVVDLRDERQNILCGGFERLGHAEVCEGEGVDIAPRLYSTFSPKCFGLIGKLTATLMDRSIEIAMQRKLSEKVERLRRRDCDDHAAFRQQCLRWANDNRQALAAIAPKAPDGLNDRAFDAWEPLLAIAVQVGGDWPKLAADAAIALSGGDPNTDEKSVELLRDISAEFARSDWPAMITKRLIAALGSDEERPWATWNKGKPITDRQIAKLLKPFGIISETVQPSETGELKDAKGYKRARFDDAFDRYLTPAKDASPQFWGAQASERHNADETGTTSDFCVRHESSCDGYEKCEKPASHGQKDARTDKYPQGGDEASSGSRNGGKGATRFRSDVEDANEELRLREAAAPDGGIPPFLDRRGEVCGHCGQPGGIEWDYRGVKVRLHERCQYPWIHAYETNSTHPNQEEINMTTPYASAAPKNARTVEVTAEYLDALRKAVGFHIDPETAEVEWIYAQMLDPYGDDPNLPEEYQQVGREYFARSPGSDVWIDFSDLPDATRDALWKKYKSRLAFPAGLPQLDLA